MLRIKGLEEWLFYDRNSCPLSQQCQIALAAHVDRRAAKLLCQASHGCIWIQCTEADIRGQGGGLCPCMLRHSLLLLLFSPTAAGSRCKCRHFRNVQRLGNRVDTELSLALYSAEFFGHLPTFRRYCCDSNLNVLISMLCCALVYIGCEGLDYFPFDLLICVVLHWWTDKMWEFKGRRGVGREQWSK